MILAVLGAPDMPGPCTHSAVGLSNNLMASGGQHERNLNYSVMMKVGSQHATAGANRQAKGFIGK